MPAMAAGIVRKRDYQDGMSHLRCFSTLGCPELSLEEVFALAAKHQVAGVEVRALERRIDLPAYFTERFGTPEGLVKAVQGKPVRVVALDGSLRLINGKEQDRQETIALAPWAEALGVRYLRIFDGGKTADEAEIADAVNTLNWWRQQRQAHGWKVELMVETHDALCTQAALARLIAAVPDVAILWDSHHTWKKGGEDPVATWKAIRSRVVHIHVKDSLRRAAEPGKYDYLPPGRGEFPFAALMETLQADGFAGPVSLEWERLWVPQLGPLDEALESMIATGRW